MVDNVAGHSEVGHESEEGAPTRFPLVAIESPYAGDVRLNVAYARLCMLDSLERGEAPYASHLLFTQPGVLDDTIEGERERGIAAGLQWASDAGAACVVYRDLGVSAGMQRGIDRAFAEGRAIEYRELPRAAFTAMVETVAVAAKADDWRDRLADLAGRLEPMGVKCTGCGSSWTDDRLAEERRKRPALRSCCPDRHMVEVYRLRDEGETGAVLFEAVELRRTGAVDDEDESRCIACDEPMKAGDFYHLDASGGEIHAACCGPEPEAYHDANGDPLKPGDPLPVALVWRP